MSDRPALRLVPAAPLPDAPQPTVRFCGSCGARPVGDLPIRICTSCDMGIVLEAGTDVAPRADEPFLVVDSNLCVRALSANAAALLGVDELDVVDRPLVRILEAADTTIGATAVPVGILGGQVERVVVRPSGTFGVRYVARTGTCGTPAATLVVIEPIGSTPPQR